MPDTSIPFVAQVVKDDSELASKPYYTNADKMRAVAGKMETIYGQELACLSAVKGVCRGAFAWADLARTAWAAFGTHLRLHVMDQDGILYDATPVAARHALTNPFSVSSGSSTVVVTHDGHGLSAQQKIVFPEAAAAANVAISGTYEVSSVISSSSYAFAASTAAVQSTAMVGGTVDVEYGLAPGNISNLGGLGYGVGGYGIGGYGGSASDQILDARTWSFAQWGQNLIANPNWGGIYEWAPNITASDRVDMGSFDSSGAWTFGSGWSLGTSAASANNGTTLTQSLTLSRNAWHLLKFDLSLSSGSLTPFLGATSLASAVSISGAYKIPFVSGPSSSQTLIFDGSSAFSGTLSNVSVTVLTSAHLIPEAPNPAGSIFLTDRRSLVACGTVNLNNGIFDPMRIQWSEEENNRLWVPDPSNLAGGYTLSHGSRIVRGLAGNRENLVFTDTAVYRMRYVPDPSVVYAFDLMGTGCGLVGPNAVVQANGLFFWVSPQGKFYMYSGAGPIPLANPSERDFRDNLADVQGSKIYAAHLSSRAEIWFFYPDERDGVECSRYHVYNYNERTWVSGIYDRTAYVDAGAFPYPIAVDPSGRIYYQEKDFSNDGGARQTSLETSYFTLGDGETFAYVKGVRPDFDDLMGGVSVTFYSRNYPQGDERVYGPYPITSNTKRISVRIKGRQIKYKLETNDAPSFYRLGAMSFDLSPSGQEK